jgi:NADPH:quinone reductase-like Zn-dependent oxidoreductase
LAPTPCNSPKASGAEVTGVSSTAKLDLVRFIGADHVINYTRDEYLTGSKKYDLIVDSAETRLYPSE